MKTIVFKTSKPFSEQVVKVAGIKNPITVGIKLYGKKEKKLLQTEYQAAAINTELEKATAILEDLQATGDRTSDEFYVLRKAQQDEVERLSEEYLARLETFYKNQILFIKNASLVIDEDGVESTIAVLDTRTADPVESLWSTPEESLAVLLDYYFEEETYKDSLPSLILSTIFNYSTKGEEKAKN